MIQQINNRAQESKGFICEFIVYASYSFGKHIPDPPIKETSMFERKMIVPSRNKSRIAINLTTIQDSSVKNMSRENQMSLHSCWTGNNTPHVSAQRLNPS